MGLSIVSCNSPANLLCAVWVVLVRLHCETACWIHLKAKGNSSRNLHKSRVSVRKARRRDELYEARRPNLKVNLTTKDFNQCLLLALLSYMPERFKGRVPFLSGSRVVSAKFGKFLPTDTAVPIRLCL